MAISLALHEQLCSLRPQLLRFTRQRIHDISLAEDVVQESLLAVLEAPERFAGKSSLTTYVIGILKFKIIDSFRRARQTHDWQTDSLSTLDDIDLRPMFTTERYGVSDSSLCEEFNPLIALERKSFFCQLESALQQLPEKSAQAFTMSDCLEIGTEEICLQLGMNKNNLMVTVHRARHTLRKIIGLQQQASNATLH